MEGPGPARPNLALLVVSWFLFLGLAASYAWISFSSERWALGIIAVVLFGALWLVMSGLIARRLWPESPIARMLPRTIRRRAAEAPVRRWTVFVLLLLLFSLVLAFLQSRAGSTSGPPEPPVLPLPRGGG